MPNLRREMAEGFIGIHNLGRDRVAVAKKFTSRVSLNAFGCVGVENRHAFYYKGYVGEIVSPHLDCTLANDTKKQERDMLFLDHPTKDLGIITE